MTDLLGPYELLRLLGRGGMAEVFLAKHPSGREYALKRLRPELEKDAESVRLFLAEAALSKSLHHPNIVTVTDVGEDQGVHYMVMDYIDGRDVGQIIKRCRRVNTQWPIEFALFLTSVLLDALDYAHHVTAADGRPLGVIHCDVSPSNFFVSRTGELKLGDFGVSRSRIEHRTEHVLGKPYYLSPEALDGDLSPAIDLWAVAVTLYELLTLQRPFQGKTPEDVFERIRACQYPVASAFRPDVPPVLDGMLARAFDVDPELRFGTASEFREAIRAVSDERIGTPLAISAIVRGLFGESDAALPRVSPK